MLPQIMLSPRHLPAAIACVLLAFPGLVLAYHPLVTDDTGTQGLAGNQLEFGYDHVRSKDGASKATERLLPLAYARGLTDALDVFVGVPRVLEADDEKGWGSPAIGLKWRFYEDERSKLSLALKPEVEFEPLDGDLGSGDPTYALSLILSRETGFGEFHANLQVAHNGDEDRETQYQLSVAPVWQVNEQWKLALDVGLMTNPDISADETMGFVELGTVYSPDENLDLSLGVIRDIMDGSASTTSASLGLTWRFR